MDKSDIGNIHSQQIGNQANYEDSGIEIEIAGSASISKIANYQLKAQGDNSSVKIVPRKIIIACTKGNVSCDMITQLQEMQKLIVIGASSIVIQLMKIIKGILL